MAKIRVYIKERVPKQYGFGLANSIHFCLVDEAGKEAELHHGYGILFPKGCIRADNTIEPRGAANPRILGADGKYYLVCDYIDEEGENRAAGQVYVWVTCDFVSFQEVGLQEEAGFESAGAELEIPDTLVPNIRERWLRKRAKATELEYPYPLIKGFADPVFFQWEEKWYFLATNDRNGNVGIYLREADSIKGLFEEQARVSVILDYSVENHFIQTFWAPEWHMIGGVPYILFAVGGEQWAPQSHMMKYKGNGSIMDPANWELPVRVKQMDGRYLSEDGITLDMTYLKDGANSYVVWSERYHIGTPLDSGSMLYIAAIDEKNPTVLISEKVLLSRPLYGWENVDGTINNEGPYALLGDGKIYVSYSGGDACGHTYAVGCLVAKRGSDLLDINSWEKYPTPLLSAYSIEGIDGPGHNSFFLDDRCNTMIAYHGQLDMRSSAIHKVQFSKDGFPILDGSKAIVHMTDWQLYVYDNTYSLAGRADSHPALGKNVYVSRTSDLVNYSYDDDILTYETFNTVYVCPLKYMSTSPYRSVVESYIEELTHRGDASDCILDKIIAATAKRSILETNSVQEIFHEKAGGKYDATRPMMEDFSKDEFLQHIMELQQRGQIEMEAMAQKERQRLIGLACNYEDCVYIEVSNVGCGSLLAYHLGDDTGVVQPSLHSGMFQDSVLYMKYAEEGDPCSLDFRYFPRGFQDIMETYSWSDNIMRAVIKNDTGTMLKFNGEDIPVGETGIFTPEGHCQGLVNPDCHNGKSCFTMLRGDSNSEASTEANSDTSTEASE